jgi:NAD(P)-dependent dehydrogenase (short-subunit alcohol dehydrogenase family)
VSAATDPGGEGRRIVVVGASSGLGRCVGIGLAQRGARTALMARRLERLEAASREAGPGTTAVAIECDATDETSCEKAMSRAVDVLGGIDALVYTPAVGPLARLVDTDARTWRQVFDTNVIGASLVTAAAMPHLTASNGTAIYFSSVSASGTPPWTGLSAYAVTKAALEKLVDAWRTEHPTVGFTCLVVGECAGGEGDSLTAFANEWDHELAADLLPQWIARGYMSGALIDAEELVGVVDWLARGGATMSLPVVRLAARPGPGGL